MADYLSKITLPNGAVYDLKDTYARQNTPYLVVGTQTAATGTWTGTLTDVSSLYDGLTILYYLPYAGSGNASLRLTLGSGTTSDVPVYWTGTSRATTHYAAGSVILLTYYNNAWRRADYDSNTNNAVTQTATTENAAYEVLFSGTADNSTRTEGARKTSTLTYNPSTKALSTGGTVNGYSLAAASAKGVDTSIAAASTSANLPTSAAVASFVEGKGYVTSHQTIKQDGVTGATVNRYGVCGTAAATAAKTASVTNGTFSLEAGARVTVKFTYANTAASPTLNVNSTGAKNIFHRGAQITSGANKELLRGVVDFIYDGTQWHLIGDTYYGVSTTAVDDITGWTTNVPTAVTKKTVVTGGSKTNIPNVTGVGSAPSLSYTARTVGSASNWSAGTAASASYADGVLTITNGTAPSLTITSTACDDITAWSAGSVPTLGTAIGAYTSLTTGDSVDVTAGTAAVLDYSGKTVVSGISGS